MSFTHLIYHIVFSTKRRERTISIEKERLMYTILFNICKEKGAFVHRIGGMPDHIHILTDLPPTLTLSEFVKTIKAESSRRVRKYDYFNHWDGWEEGYGAFTVSYAAIPTIKEYIINQKQHHRGIDFATEYAQWLIDNGIEETTPFFPTTKTNE